MKRKLLSCVLSLVMVLSLLPTMAFAAGTDEGTNCSTGCSNSSHIAAIGDTHYTSLSAAFIAAVKRSGSVEVDLLRDSNAGAGIGSGGITLDLNGHSINVTYSNNKKGAVVWPALLVQGSGKLTLTDSSTGKDGKVLVHLTGGVKYLTAAAAVLVDGGGTFELQNGALKATKSGYGDAFGILVRNTTGTGTSCCTMTGGSVEGEYGVRVQQAGSSFMMSGGTVTGDVGVSGQGDVTGDTNIRISGGTITGKFQGIYQPQTGMLDISGGTVTGWGGVEVKSGTVTISGSAKIVSRVPDDVDPKKAVELFGDTSTGTSSAGYAVAVVEDNSYAGGADVTISGGTFAGKLALLKSGQEIVDHDAVLKISGGVFNETQVRNYLKGDVCWPAATTSGSYTVATSHKYDVNDKSGKTKVIKEPTCTTDGSETLLCTVCGKAESDGNGVVTRKISMLGHDFSVWCSDKTSHWQKCSRDGCSATTKKETHETSSTCTTCGYNCEHSSVETYAGVAATCATEGYGPYTVCKTCGKHVEASSGDGKYTVTSDDLVTIEKQPHTYTWERNGSQHWQVCSVCGYTTAKLDHEYSGRSCTVCDYAIATYAVSVNTAKNGSVSVSPKNASKGTTVTVTTTPDKGWTLETLTVLDKNGKEVELTIVTVGEKYTFKMPSGKVTVSATFMEDNTMLNYFADVTASDYFYDAVLWAAEKGITTGVDDLHFAPNDTCTRAQIVTFLWRAAGSPEPKSVSSFSDVASDSYYAKAVAWAVENGITNGTGAGAFSPDEVCTRAQSVTFLARALGGKAAASTSFSDVPVDSWYAEAVAWAAENGVTKGIGGGLFGSDSDCTRGQIVTFLFRAYVK